MMFDFIKAHKIAQNILSEKEKLVNISLLIGVVFSLPLLASSLLRAVDIGWQSVFYLHFMLAGLVFLLFLFRDRASYHLKVNTILSILITLYITGLYNFGLFANDEIIAMTIPLLGAIFYGTRTALFILLFEMIYMFTIAILSHYKMITFTVTASDLGNSLFQWIETSISLLTFISVLILSIGKLEFVSNKMILLNDALSEISSNLIDMSTHSIDELSQFVLKNALEMVEATGGKITLEINNVPQLFTLNDISQNQNRRTISFGSHNFKGEFALFSDEELIDEEVHVLEQLMKMYSAGISAHIRQNDNKNLNEYKSHTQQIMIEQQKRVEMGEMIGAISHQLKQPLNNIYLNAQLLEESMLNSEDRESITSIEEQVEFMSITIDDFRTFFREDREKSEFNIYELVRSIYRILGQQLHNANIELSIEIDPQLTLVSYPGEFKQIVLNLVNNAKEAMIENKIAIGAILIKASMTKEYLTMEVIDNGGGVPEHVIEHIFDSYFTTKGEKGTGIGLHIIKTIITEHMKGTIDVSNNHDGAQFIVTIPID
jgi:signal transduction histidine kinase